jgi:hypothetical protein
MTVFSQRSHEGELMIDHRASPGIPEHVARAWGYEPKTVGEGSLCHMATLGCAHCNAVVVLQPLRTRERASCLKCGGRYICDYCDAARRAPDYDHRPFEKMVDMVGSEKFTLQGPLWNPLLIPTGGQNG